MIVFVSIYFVANFEEIDLIDGDFVFKNNRLPVSNMIFDFVIFFVLTPYFLLILYKANSFTRSLMSKSSRIRGFLLIFLMELNGIIIFLSSVFGFSWEILIISRILDWVSIMITFYIFYPHDFAESMLMLLNVELVYISDENGKILHVSAFLPGKNKKTHDALVGGLVKSVDNIVKEIKIVRSVGLSRIVLIDGTAIIIEKSKKSQLYYIVFTRTYTKFTHEKVHKLRDKIDQSYGNKLKFIISESEQFTVDKLISEAFLE